MKQMKLFIILIFIFTMVIAFSTVSLAEYETFELQLDTSSETFNTGDTFSVDIIIDNINVTTGDQGIGAYQAKIIYDDSILEFVNVTEASGWEILENEGSIVANTSTGIVVNDRTKTATINFKVKENAIKGNTSISLENIKGSSGTTTIDGKGISKLINVVEKNNSDENTTGDIDNNTNSTVGENNTVVVNNSAIRNNTSISSNIDSSTTNKMLPNAGLKSVAVIGIVIFIMVSIVFYIKYKRAI